MRRPDLDDIGARAAADARQIAVEAVEKTGLAPVARLGLFALAVLRSLGPIRPPRRTERARVTIIETTARELGPGRNQ